MEKTVLLEANLETNLWSRLIGLCHAPRVGAVVLPQFLGAEEVAQLINVPDDDFHDIDIKTIGRFGTLMEVVARKFDRKKPMAYAKHPQTFVHEHPWHLAVTNPVPTVRVWTHLRGGACITFARAKDFTVPTGPFLNEDEIRPYIYGEPAHFTPDPGDTVLFIDKGTEHHTGTSTFHNVEVVRDEANPRLGFSFDIVIGSEG